MTSLSSSAVLTLDSALSIALRDNRGYRISVVDARTAADKVSWGAAGALPRVDATGAYSQAVDDIRQQRLSTLSTGGTGLAEEKDNGVSAVTKTAGVNATWPVFQGLTSVATHDRLAATAEQADQHREQTRQDLAAQVILAYSNVVQQQTILAAMDTAVALSQERVKLTQGKYGFGSVSRLELLQAQLDLNADLSVRFKQIVVLASAKRQLNAILARPDSLQYEVEDTIPLEPAPPYEGLRQAALEASPAVRQAMLNKTIASAGLREYVGKLMPEVDLNLGYNYSDVDAHYGTVRLNEALGWNYGVSVKFNLFDGGQLPDDYRAARRQVQKADLVYDDARAQVESALAEAHGSYQASLQVLDLEKSNLGVARENETIATERMRLGTIASLDLRDAQDKFVAAQTRLVSARFESKRTETELLRLAGRLAR